MKWAFFLVLELQRLFISKWGRISPESYWCWVKKNSRNIYSLIGVLGHFVLTPFFMILRTFCSSFEGFHNLLEMTHVARNGDMIERGGV